MLCRKVIVRAIDRLKGAAEEREGGIIFCLKRAPVCALWEKVVFYSSLLAGLGRAWIKTFNLLELNYWSYCRPDNIVANYHFCRE